MAPLFPTFYMVVLLGIILLGLALLATGIVLLIKMKNKLPGGLVVVLGAVFTLFPVFLFLALFTTRLVGG